MNLFKLDENILHDDTNLFTLCKKYCIAMLVFFFSTLAIIQIIFSIKAPCKLLKAVWTPGDLLSFIAGFLVLLSTVIIATIQFKLLLTQNKLIKIQTDIDKENHNIERMKRIPKIKLDSYVFDIPTITLILQRNEEEPCVISKMDFSYLGISATNRIVNTSAIGIFTKDIKTPTPLSWQIQLHLIDKNNEIDKTYKFENLEVTLTYTVRNRYGDIYTFIDKYNINTVNKEMSLINQSII